MYVPLEDFRCKAATHMVSLGSRCAVAHNFRRHFNFCGAFPFDWWIVDGDGLVRFLDHLDIDMIYDTVHLELTEGYASIRNREYGFLLHHEFPRHWQAENQPIRADWANFIDRPKERTRALLAKFLSLNREGNRVVFGRDRGVPDGLSGKLSSLFPLPQWTLIDLGFLPDAGGKHGWKGDPQSWSSLLSTFRLHLDISGHRPFLDIDTDPAIDSAVGGERRLSPDSVSPQGY